MVETVIENKDGSKTVIDKADVVAKPPIPVIYPEPRDLAKEIDDLKAKLRAQGIDV